jgi:protease I
LYRLREAGVVVHLVGPEAGKTYPSKLGYPAKAEFSIQDVRAEDYQGLIIPGGFCPDYIRRHPRMIEFTQAMDQARKPLAAICHGPWVLCSTRALKGRRATGFHSIRDDMINAGATFVDEPVVVDGHVLTSRTPDDLPVFMAAFLKALAL